MTIRLAVQNSMSSTDIRYAGSKDRRAITTQYITSPKQLNNNETDIVLEHVGFTHKPLSLGELEANEFLITAYDVSDTRDVQIPNYFGNQRFSSQNVEVGLLLLRKQFLEAANHLRGQYKEIDKHLLADENDGIGALRRAPRLSLIMYVHAVQSWLYNEAVNQYVIDNYESYKQASYRHGTLTFPHKKLPSIDVPVVGAAQDLGEWEKYYAPLFRKHNITPGMFYIRSLPYLTQEGETRSLQADVRKKEVSLQEETAKIHLILGSSCYATIVLAGLLI